LIHEGVPDKELLRKSFKKGAYNIEISNEVLALEI
jgi:hypothetical protein